MKKSFNYWTRKLHRWGAVACFIPLLLVIVTGILLQVKKQVPWVQPPGMKAPAALLLTFDDILRVASSDPKAGIESWADIDRLDVRVKDGIVKVQPFSRQELQIDLATGEILSSKYRRSDLIETLHDGSFFGDIAKLGVFLPNGIILFLLYLTGIWLWYLPFRAKAAKRRRQATQPAKV